MFSYSSHFLKNDRIFSFLLFKSQIVYMVDDMILLLKDCVYFTGKVRPDKNLIAGEQDVTMDLM